MERRKAAPWEDPGPTWRELEESPRQLLEKLRRRLIAAWNETSARARCLCRCCLIALGGVLLLCACLVMPQRGALGVAAVAGGGVGLWHVAAAEQVGRFSQWLTESSAEPRRLDRTATRGFGVILAALGVWLGIVCLLAA